MASQKNVHYFPGHMKKALNNLSNYINSVDVVVEIVDARAPFSTRNPYLNDICKNKPRVILLSKEDLADKAITEKWISSFKDEGLMTFSADLKKNKLISLLKDVCSPIIKIKREKEKKIGMKPQPLRAMVVGVPNVGKSTFINNVVGKKKVIVGNKAGVTRGNQWIRVSEDFDLLDTPGVLPMSYEDKNKAVKLALLGNMKEEILPVEALSSALYDFLRSKYSASLKERFGIEDLKKFSWDDSILEIAKRRGLLENGSNPSVSKAAYLLIKEFKEGLLGQISLEEPNA